MGRKKPKKVSFAPQLPRVDFCLVFDLKMGGPRWCLMGTPSGCKRFEFDGEWAGGHPPLQEKSRRAVQDLM